MASSVCGTFRSPPREALMVRLLRAGSDNALSHESALELYGLTDVPPTTTHLIVPALFRLRPHAVALHHEPLSPTEVALWDDLRLTTVETTIVDCFRWRIDRDRTVADL